MGQEMGSSPFLTFAGPKIHGYELAMNEELTGK